MAKIWVREKLLSLHLHCLFPIRNPAELTQGVSKSSDGATLSFTSVTQSDESIYTCTANSTGGGFGGDSIFVDVISM